MMQWRGRASGLVASCCLALSACGDDAGHDEPDGGSRFDGGAPDGPDAPALVPDAADRASDAADGAGGDACERGDPPPPCEDPAVLSGCAPTWDAARDAAPGCYAGYPTEFRQYPATCGRYDAIVTLFVDHGYTLWFLDGALVGRSTSGLGPTGCVAYDARFTRVPDVECTPLTATCPTPNP